MKGQFVTTTITTSATSTSTRPIVIAHMIRRGGRCCDVQWIQLGPRGRLVVVIIRMIQMNGFVTEHERYLDQFIFIPTTCDFVVVVDIDSIIIIISAIIIILVVVVIIVVIMIVVIFIVLHHHGVVAMEVPGMAAAVGRIRMVPAGVWRIRTRTRTTTTRGSDPPEKFFFQDFVFFQSFGSNHTFQLKVVRVRIRPNDRVVRGKQWVVVRPTTTITIAATAAGQASMMTTTTTTPTEETAVTGVVGSRRRRIGGQRGGCAG